jgi:predicted O-methyltransferase YrrM
MGIVLKKVKRAIKARGLGFAVKHSVTRLGDWRRTRQAVRSKPQFTSIDDLLDFSFGKGGAFIRPFQIRSEIKGMLQVVRQLRPERMLEIGTANGGTLFLWTRVVADNATLISLDLPSGNFGDGYPKWKSPLYRSFATPRQAIHLLREDSHAQGSLEHVRQSLQGKLLDFLFIDGDHGYEGTKMDFEVFSTLVRSGGIVAFHDIAEHADPHCEVRKFWMEIRTRFPFEEFIEPVAQGWGGIGYITMP